MLPQSSRVAANFIEHLQATRFLDQYYKQRVVVELVLQIQVLRDGAR
jgi:hypothetical protein